MVATNLGVRFYAELSLLDIISIFEILGVGRYRSTVHRRPIYGVDPNHVVDGTVTRLDDERDGLYAAVGPDTNCLLRVRLYPTGNTATAPMVPSEIREKRRGRRRPSRRRSPAVAGGVPPARIRVPAEYTRHSERRRTCISRIKTVNYSILKYIQSRRTERRRKSGTFVWDQRLRTLPNRFDSGARRATDVAVTPTRIRASSTETGSGRMIVEFSIPVLCLVVARFVAPSRLKYWGSGL